MSFFDNDRSRFYEERQRRIRESKYDNNPEYKYQGDHSYTLNVRGCPPVSVYIDENGKEHWDP